jgi:hypothetical protein
MTDRLSVLALIVLLALLHPGSLACIHLMGESLDSVVS